jgi:hypothetical protein
MNRFISLPRLACLAASLATLSACSTIAEKTNFMSDSDIQSKVAGTLGYTPDAITLLSRRTEGTNTYVVVRAGGKKEFACTLNGGNLLSGGIVNPPSCAPKT